jgi:hypothetical protein
MTPFLRKLFPLLAIFFTTSYIQAQENNDPKEAFNKTYIISDKGSVSDVQPYIDALNNSNMTNHRLKNQHYTIVFKGGLKVELFSATEIAANGWKINPSNYPDTFDSSRNEPIFGLAPNNFIIEYHTSSAKHP